MISTNLSSPPQEDVTSLIRSNEYVNRLYLEVVGTSQSIKRGYNYA